jgi:hypothetical protein
MLGRSHNVGEQHRGQQPLGASGLELQGVYDHVADASREVDLVAVGGLLEVRGLPGRLTPHRLVELAVEAHPAGAPGYLDSCRGAGGAMDGDLAGPAEAQQHRACRSRQCQLCLAGGVLHLDAEDLDRAQVGPQPLQASGSLDPPGE